MKTSDGPPFSEHQLPCSEDTDEELEMYCWTGKQFYEKGWRKQVWSWVRNSWVWGQVNRKRRRMLHMLNDAEVVQLPGKEVTMKLMSVFHNRLGTSWTIFSIALMETCVRACDSWTFDGEHSRTAFQKRMEQSWQHMLLQNFQTTYRCSQGGEQPVLFM